MGDGSLSQDEIDALLQGADDILTTPSATPSMDYAARGGGGLSPAERDSLADLLNSTMEMVVPSLSGYLGKNITITNAYVEIKSQADIRKDFGKKYIQLPVNFTGGFTGNNLIVFNYEDAEIISSLMMGDESGTPPEEMTDAHQSTIQEFVSQMLSSMATGFSNKLGRSIGITPPNLSVVNRVKDLQLPPGDEIAKVTYNIKIENLINSKFYQLIELSLGSDIAKSLMAGSGGGMPAMPQQAMGQMEQQMGSQVGISQIKFPPLGESVPYGAGTNISLLLDVPMTLTVELGRTRQLVKDILGLGEGSIIELDKLAGEPVDLLVNGKLIAKGEVVVIDENFGVRITDIVSPAERFGKVQ